MIKIGIPLSISKSQFYINQAYINYIVEAGYYAVPIAPGMDPDTAISGIDGLLLPGGIDIDPMYYGDENWASISVDPEKDEFERDLLHTARSYGIPIMGICRGFQLIVCELMLDDLELTQWMEFYQHVNDHAQTSQSELALSRNVKSHFVSIRPNVLYGATERAVTDIPVNSMHHQALIVNFKDSKTVSVRKFCLAAWTYRGLPGNLAKQNKAKNNANHYRVCEAFSVKDWGSPVLAVQWHPEELKDIGLIQNFFNKHCGAEGGKTQEAS